MTRTTLATLLALVALTNGAAAAGSAMPAVDLPAICLANAGHAGMAMGDNSMGGSMAMAPMASDQPHGDLMAGMAQMNADMMVGATATDPDAAFVCSMIPHHRGAIAMAKAELANGDDPWARTLAEQIIAAQEKEIADMLDWLNKQSK
jgi:uncharacterized protein (DUF305 family)